IPLVRSGGGRQPGLCGTFRVPVVRRARVPSRRYGPDVLATGKPRRRELRRVPAQAGLVVEDATGRFCGAVVGCEKDAVTLEDRHGRRRVFPLRPAAFLLEGEAVMLVRPAEGTGPGTPGAGRVRARTASGSIAAPAGRA